MKSPIMGNLRAPPEHHRTPEAKQDQRLVGAPWCLADRTGVCADGPNLDHGRLPSSAQGSAMPPGPCALGSRLHGAAPPASGRPSADRTPGSSHSLARTSLTASTKSSPMRGSTTPAASTAVRASAADHPQLELEQTEHLDHVGHSQPGCSLVIEGHQRESLLPLLARRISKRNGRLIALRSRPRRRRAGCHAGRVLRLSSVAATAGLDWRLLARRWTPWPRPCGGACSLLSFSS